jgi:two-component system phosphate regulon sensor histidine kinase PhoR
VLLRHGGTLTIKSEAGKGSSFIVSMPTSLIAPVGELEFIA